MTIPSSNFWPDLAADLEDPDFADAYIRAYAEIDTVHAAEARRLVDEDTSSD